MMPAGPLDLDIRPLVPARYADYAPIIVDALVYFVSRLSAPRQFEIAAGQASLPADAGVAQRLVTLMQHCPVLHKLGQVVARNHALDADLRRWLQTLESMPARTPREWIHAVAQRELGDALSTFDIRIGDAPLAQASVAVVMPITWRSAPGAAAQAGVLKLLRPGIQERLSEELAVLAAVGDFLDGRAARDGLPAIDYRGAFETVSEILAGETHFAQEQLNLAAARRRHAERREVVIPALLPFCTPQITAMQRVCGVKVTQAANADAAEGDDGRAEFRSPVRRRRLASTIIEALAADVVLCADDPAPFHADPHAGNLMVDADDRLAILDWALVGTLSKVQREQVVQVLIGGVTLDPGRMGAALEGLAESLPAEASVSSCIESAMERIVRGEWPGAKWLAGLLDAVARHGARFGGDLLLFRKTLLTVEDVAADVSADVSLDGVLLARAARAWACEWPMRCWQSPGSRGYALHLSNADLLGLAAQSPWIAARWWARAWRGA